MPTNGKWTLVLLAILGISALAPASEIVDFEDVDLAPNSYYNGSDFAGGFHSGGIDFETTFVDAGTYTYWSGVAVSNMADRETAGFTNQYSVYTPDTPAGNTFAVATGESEIRLPAPAEFESIDLANTTYAYLSIRDGDWFNDKFGGEDGLEQDWFKLILTGKDAEGSVTGTVEFYLADYRPSGTADDYIVDEWTTVDLASLGEVSAVEFSWDSSDKGSYGINTPAYVAFDNVTVTEIVPEPATLALLAGGWVVLRRRR
jgi:hypothetical protein